MQETGPSLRRARYDATVEVNKPLCREHYLLRLRIDPAGPAFPATQPGQFIQLGCRPPAGTTDMDALRGQALDVAPDGWPSPAQPELCSRLALLRRPLSLAGRGDDAEGTWLEVIHRVVGVGTAWLGGLRPGDAVDLIGPLGNAFGLPEGKSRGLLVGGGVGLPPMFYLAERLKAAGWDAVGFVGAMSRDLLAVTWEAGIEPDAGGCPVASAAEFARHGYPAVITTDDGSVGLRGRITTGLSQYIETLDAADRAATVVFTCGPDPMMHAVAKLAAAAGIACQVCLEQAMACGMGTCQSCVVAIDASDERASGGLVHGVTQGGRPWRYRLACTDGPVFASEQVVWGGPNA